MRVPEFIEVLSCNYFDRYLPEGGSTFKTAVVSTEAVGSSLSSSLKSVAQKHGGLSVHLLSSVHKLHMMDKLFVAVANSVNWEHETLEFVRRYILQDYEIGDVQPVDLDAVAKRARCSHEHLRNKIACRIRDHISHDYAYSSEFRLALTQLCLGCLATSGSPMSPYRALIQQWLRAELSSVTGLRGAFIYRKIQRSTARHMLYSTFHFLRRCGHKYVLLLLDISRYLDIVKVAERGDGFYYSYGATLDLYELLRQCIDDVQEFEGAMIMVIAPRSLLNDQRRGIERYQALKMRLVIDFRVKNATNPLSPLVSLW
jgi:P-loop Domain of unknown function (DUF2791)